MNGDWNMPVPYCFSELISEITSRKVPLHVAFQCNPKYYIPHRHNFIEFSYIVKGSGSELVNNKRHDLKPGTFSAILPYQVHSLNYS